MPETEAERRARWEGRTDAHQAENSRRIDGINGGVDQLQECQTEILTEIAALKTKVGLFAAIGGLLGAGIVTFILTVVTGGSG